MSLNALLASAQGGSLHAKVASALGVDEKTARSAMDALCPAIAQQMKAAAAADEDLFDDLLSLLEEGSEGSPLEDAEALTGAEARSDGNEILKDIYGSKDKGLKALASLAPGVPAKALAPLAAISATAVVAALTQANQPMALTGAQTAIGGGGILGSIVEAVVRGVVSEAKRQVSQRTGVRWGTRRRSSSTRRRKTTKRKTSSSSRKRSSAISLEDIFRSILK